MELEERKAKQEEAINERRGTCAEQPLTPKDHKLCEKLGFGAPIAKFRNSADGMLSIFCSLE